jgi:hypothetical protein
MTAKYLQERRRNSYKKQDWKSFQSLPASIILVYCIGSIVESARSIPYGVHKFARNYVLSQIYVPYTVYFSLIQQ